MMDILHTTLDEGLDLELGGHIEKPSVAYSTIGTLSEHKDNVTLVCHALTANSQVDDWWTGLYGSGKVLDPEEDFIICINNMGSPYGTTSPKSTSPSGNRYGLDFPDYTLRDIARLHIRLLDSLGIKKLRLVIGGSCGGNIAQEIAISKGGDVEQMILMCCSVCETPWVIGIHESQRIALRSDPTLYDEGPDAGANGLRSARACAIPFYRSHASFKLRQEEQDINKTDNFKASSYVRYQGDKFVDRYDALCYYKQITALDTHNIGRGRNSIKEGLGLIKARTLCIGFSSDLLIPVVEQELLAELIPDGTYAEVETIFGHDAFLIEADKIQHVIDNWTYKR